MNTTNNISSRRSFLKTAGAVTAASTLPLWLIEECAAQPRRKQAESLPPSEKVNLALIGCGGQGRGDARNAARFGQVVAVCDKECLGKQLRKGKFQFSVSDQFFNGKLVSLERAINILRQSNNFNAVGEKIISELIKLKIIHPEGILEIDNIPIAIKIV